MSNKTYQTVAVGNAIVDILARVNDAFLGEHGVEKAAMVLVDDEKASAIYEGMGVFGATVECSGGSAANTLAAMAGLGAKTGFIGKTRDDQMGEVFRHDMRAIGVDFNTAPASEGDATGRCLVCVTSDGERSMATHLGVCAQVHKSDVDEAMVKDAEILYIEGYLWDQPSAKEAILHAMDLAKASGAKLAMTLSDVFCVERHRDEMRDLVENRLDILFANEAEIGELYDTDDIEVAVKALQSSIDLALITRSEMGAIVVTREAMQMVPTAPVDPVVDTTGAGDLFAAGFLYGFTQGWEHQRSAKLGHQCAGRIIQQIGARSQMPLESLVAA